MTSPLPGLLVAAALLLIPDLVAAQGLWAETADPTTAERGPTLLAARHALARGALPEALAQALAAIDTLRAARPNDAEVWHMRGTLLHRGGDYEQSATSFERSLELAPQGPLAHEAAFDLGVVLTRLGRFQEAAAGYERFLQEWPGRWMRATALTNLAEALMGQGLLQEAVVRYREAIATEPGYAHASFGVAVALDRLGRVSDAQSAMLTAATTGLGLAELDVEGVFFVPEWEIHYYRALALETVGRVDEAREQWTLFLANGGAAGPYAARARAHLTALPPPD